MKSLKKRLENDTISHLLNGMVGFTAYAHIANVECMLLRALMIEGMEETCDR